jgi:hypothetical protein
MEMMQALVCNVNYLEFSDYCHEKEFFLLHNAALLSRCFGNHGFQISGVLH